MTNVKKLIKLAKGICLEYPQTTFSFKKGAEEGRNIKEPKKLFGNFITECSLTLFPSPRGTGKSWMALQNCISVAGCHPELCGEKIELHGNTLYANYEIGSMRLRKRIHQLLTHSPYQ